MASEPSQSPEAISPGRPCPNCGRIEFSRFVFVIGEKEASKGPRSFSREVVRCVGCNVALRGDGGDWSVLMENEFEQALATDKEMFALIQEKFWQQTASRAQRLDLHGPASRR